MQFKLESDSGSSIAGACKPTSAMASQENYQFTMSVTVVLCPALAGVPVEVPVTVM
jgi:hypothetical protein